MPIKKTVSLIIGLVILALAVFALLQTAKHPKINKLRATFKDKVGIVYGNLLDSVAPSRKYPVTTIDLEEHLKNSLPVPFTSFNQEDWEWFWHLLYGRYTVDSRGWPGRKRQLTKQEIQNKFIDYYHRPFGSFSQRQWDIFWQHVLKGKVFKR